MEGKQNILIGEGWSFSSVRILMGVGEAGGANPL